VKNALLGMKSKYREVFELVVNYQNGNWERFERSAKKLSLNETIAPKLYLESVDWADRIASLKSDPEAAAVS
jgi:EAL and modified HD-GYP domain-containing signal transduction protein